MIEPHFSYDASREYCKEHGMVFMESWVPGIDAAFWRLNLTQMQVDALMREYIWRIKYLFTPSHYTWKQRVLMAVHFLFKKEI